MTDTKNTVSDELLADLIREAANEDWEDLVLALTELQSLRSQPAGVEVSVKPLVWEEDEIGWWCAQPPVMIGGAGYEVRVTDSGKVRSRRGREDWAAFDGTLDEAKAAAQDDYERRIRSALDLSPADTQCCMCGKTGLSTIEGDGGTECQLEDGRWTCSEPCWEKAGGYGPDLSPAEGEPVGLFRKTGGAWKQVPDEWADHPNVQPLYASPSNPVISDEMVERAVEAWPDGLNDPRNKIAIRAMLTAALSQPQGE